jgi:hypothetical protein
MENSARYSPGICHEYARDRFNSKKMATSYLKIYEQVLAGRALNQKPPKLKEIQHEKFLEWTP